MVKKTINLLLSLVLGVFMLSISTKDTYAACGACQLSASTGTPSTTFTISFRGCDPTSFTVTARNSAGTPVQTQNGTANGAGNASVSFTGLPQGNYNFGASDGTTPFCTSLTATVTAPNDGGSGDTGSGRRTEAEIDNNCPAEHLNTAIGCIPFTSSSALVSFFVSWGLGISGGVAMLALIYAGFLVMTSAGDPKRLESGKEMVVSSLSGIVLLAFSIFILRLIGVDILGLFG